MASVPKSEYSAGSSLARPRSPRSPRSEGQRSRISAVTVVRVIRLPVATSCASAARQARPSVRPPDRAQVRNSKSTSYRTAAERDAVKDDHLDT